MCGPKRLISDEAEFAMLRKLRLKREQKQKEEAREKHLNDIETVNQNARGK
jgi:hypothetical protein